MANIIDKVFTPKILMNKYITNKIRYNPKSYSFKDKLIAVGINDKDTHVNKINYDCEATLEELIFRSYSPGNVCWKIRKDYGLDDSDEHMIYPRVITGTPCFIKRDNMYFKPENLIRYLNLSYNMYVKRHDEVLNKVNLDKLLNSDDLDALLQLHIALCSENSIVPYLIWQGSDWEYLTLTEVMQMSPVATALENSLTVPVVRFYESEFATFAPVSTKVTNMCDEWDDICEPGAVDIVAPILHNTYFKCILYGFEVLHAICTIPNSKHTHTLEQLLLRNTTELSDILYYNNGGNFTFTTDEVRDIVYTNNPEERFNKITNYIKTNHIYESVLRFVTAVSSAPEWLLETVGFCNEYAVWVNRVKYLSIIYKFCLDNKILDKFKEEQPYAYSALTSDLEELRGTMEMDVTSSLMDLNLGDSYSNVDTSENDSTTPDFKSKHTPTAEALDKIKASYTDDKYRFDVEDVVDTKVNTRYENIANHTYLLNKTLINRIKDIKVYNTGGKNPGKSKGKLDRKALYKYKTTKDIFYDNTYKVKESDLAFGIILDVSGSMHGKGIENGVATMIILHETLKALGINHAIITHTSDGRYHSKIRRYQAFREDKTYSTLKNYALANIKSYYGNCDSGALYYMEQAFKRVKNKDKICLIFSDGEPTECTDTDLKEQVRSMERKGIKVIGIGIDYDNIQEYYSNYANGKNLSEMFTIVSEILKQYVLEKES